MKDRTTSGAKGENLFQTWEERLLSFAICQFSKKQVLVSSETAAVARRREAIGAGGALGENWRRGGQKVCSPGSSKQMWYMYKQSGERSRSCCVKNLEQKTNKQKREKARRSFLLICCAVLQSSKLFSYLRRTIPERYSGSSSVFQSLKTFCLSWTGRRPGIRGGV